MTDDKPRGRPGQIPDSQTIKDRNYARSAATTAGLLFDKKWKVHLLCAMRFNSVRLGQFARLIPEASKKVLVHHLRQLEADGIVVRVDKSDLLLHVEYELEENSRQDIVSLLDHLAMWESSRQTKPDDLL